MAKMRANSTAQPSAQKSGLGSSAKSKAVSPPVSTGFWLMKSEPESYSIDTFKKDKKTLWTGVRNYQARNFMIGTMNVGDQILFYHSNAEPSGVVGVGKILRTNLPDPTAQDSRSEYFDPKASADHPIWFCAEVGYVAHLKTLVPLSEIRNRADLQEMQLLRKGQRLSILPVTKKEFETIVKMGGGLK